MSPRIFVSSAILLTLTTAALAGNWPGWRGPDGTGVTTETELPLTWSATENVRWKIALPEAGNSTPIVWGERVFLTQSVGNRRTLMCVDRKDGKVLWQAGPEGTAAEQTHKGNTYCAASPATDGERVVAWFGSAGLYAWDLAGKELWRVDLGKQDHIWGYAGAPVFAGDLCILYFGPGPRSFLVAVDKRTGKEAWRVDAPETPAAKERTDGFAGQPDGMVATWSVPLLVKAGGRDELVMTFPERMRAFDPQTGKELWSCGGLSPLLYTSPMFGDGVLVGSGGYGGNTIAVKPGGSGDVTAQRLWQKIRDKQRTAYQRTDPRRLGRHHRRSSLHPERARHRALHRLKNGRDEMGGASRRQGRRLGIVVLNGALRRAHLRAQPVGRHVCPQGQPEV